MIIPPIDSVSLFPAYSRAAGLGGDLLLTDPLEAKNRRQLYESDKCMTVDRCSGEKVRPFLTKSHLNIGLALCKRASDFALSVLPSYHPTYFD
jgi:hypothetical protein